METKRATIKRGESKTSLIFHVNKKEFEILLTEDNPNNIKSAFNGLLKELKKGPFKFTLEDDHEDLYYNISSEYIIQLNSELKSVYDELRDYSLLQN